MGKFCNEAPGRVSAHLRYISHAKFERLSFNKAIMDVQATPPNIWIIGCSGSGKSTLARRLAERSGLPYYELDGIFHQPDWTPMPDEEFCARLTEIVATDGWIMDGNYYRRCPGVIAARTELVVWLDLPRGQTFWRVVRRSLRRVIRAEELWNGNRESWSTILSPDPDKNIILWTWRQHPVYRRRYEQAMADGSFGSAQMVRLRSAREVDEWLAREWP